MHHAQDPALCLSNIPELNQEAVLSTAGGRFTDMVIPPYITETEDNSSKPGLISVGASENTNIGPGNSRPSQDRESTRIPQPVPIDVEPSLRKSLDGGRESPYINTQLQATLSSPHKFVADLLSPQTRAAASTPSATNDPTSHINSNHSSSCKPGAEHFPVLRSPVLTPHRSSVPARGITRQSAALSTESSPPIDIGHPVYQQEPAINRASSTNSLSLREVISLAANKVHQTSTPNSMEAIANAGPAIPITRRIAFPESSSEGATILSVQVPVHGRIASSTGI